MPNYRLGLGDDAERYIRHVYGYIEYRYAPGGTVEIVNIEVDSEHRCKGVGRWLIGQLFAEVLKKDAQTVYAITRIDNRIARQWYEKLGFHIAGVLRGFYQHEHTADAILYARNPRGPV